MSQDVPGVQGKPRAPERWPESSGTGLGRLPAFFCQVWSFSMLLWRLQVAPGEVELCLRRSLEVRESPELQNGGLRALGAALDDFLITQKHKGSIQSS